MPSLLAKTKRLAATALADPFNVFIVDIFHYILDGKVPSAVAETLLLCVNRVGPDCVSGLGRSEAGRAKICFLKGRPMPAVCGNAADEENVSIRNSSQGLGSVGRALQESELIWHRGATLDCSLTFEELS